MIEKTNKEILLLVSAKLDTITLEQEKQAKAHFQLSCDFSNFMNGQNIRNSKIDDYLESNPKTNQKGLIEKVDLIEKRIDSNDLKQKVKDAKTYGAVGVMVVVLNFALKWFFNK